MSCPNAVGSVLWLLVLGAVPTLSGCGFTSRLAVGTMADVVEEATLAAWASNDPQLVREAIPANLLLLEGLLRTHERDDLLILAAQFHFSYSFAFIEDEAPERAVELYRKGRDYGLRVLRKRGDLDRALATSDIAALERALARLGQADVPALFWTAASWAAWINLSLESPAAIADLALVEMLLGRVLELDAGFQWGMPHLMMGAFYAGRAPLLGGDPERGLEHFARGRELADGKLLLASLFEARYYAIQTFNEELFERRLREVLETPPDILPEAELLNRVAHDKARDLLVAREDIF